MKDRHRMDGTRAKTIRVTGVLDIPEALRLAAALSGIPVDVQVHVDVRSAREMHDAAVVALARAIAPRNGGIIGLSRHHATLLGYFGNDAVGAAP
jgi:hypothetical protein